MICLLLRSNLTPIPVYYHNTNSILMLGDVLQFIYNLPRIDLYLVDHQCNPHPCSISQNKLYFTDWKCIPIDFKFAKHLFPLFEYQCNPRTYSIPLKKAVFNYLYIYSNLSLNCQALISPWFSTNGIPIPVQYHKKICILLLGN